MQTAHRFRRSSARSLTSGSLSTGLALLLVACGDSGSDDGGGGSGGGDGGTGGQASAQGVDPAAFLASGLVTSITTVDCTLSGGTETNCYKIETLGAPQDHDVGPFCPRNISESDAVGGIWPEGGVKHEVSGAFIADLANFYDDDVWQLYDPDTGVINVTDTQEKCEGAAKPDVDPEYYNYCVECSLDYVGGGVVKTFYLPVAPVPLSSPASIGGMGALVGVALNGINFDPPAPVSAILGAHTLAPFDDCGGHVNTHAGYHYHAATGCGTQVTQADGHAPLIGYAMDGYGLYAMTDDEGVEPADLDECRGHSDDDRGYHYHVAGAGENLFIGCFHGEQGSLQ